MSYGTFYMYYICPYCERKFKHRLDSMSDLGASFGHCPSCAKEAAFVDEGALKADDAAYEEID